MTSLETVRAQLQEVMDTNGFRAPLIHPIARDAYPDIKTWTKADRDRFMTELWKSGKMEEGVVAIYVYRRFAKSLGASEFSMFEKWIDRYVWNWGLCDGVSAWLLGACIANEPDLAARLDSWTKSRNRWKRRAAAVSLVKEAKQGRNTAAIFRVCDLLLGDQDDMVQKGVGWVLKDAYPKRPREVVRFLTPWRASAPRLVLRIAGEKMTAKDKDFVLGR